MDDTRKWLHAPKQGRSQETTERIVAAALELFTSRSFESVPVGDVASRAEVSVGGLYARFKNKDALLQALDEHLLDEALGDIRRAMDPDQLRDADAGGVVEAYVRAMISFFVRYRSLMRQIFIRARTTEDEGFSLRMRNFNSTVHGLLKARLMERQKEIAWPEPASPIEFAIMMISATAREAVLFGERKMNLSTIRGRALVDASVRAFLAYLGVRNAIQWTSSRTVTSRTVSSRNA